MQPPPLVERRNKLEEKKKAQQPILRSHLKNGDTPRCSDFGIYRKMIYKGQGFYFCGNCDEYDSIRFLSNRVQRNSLKHRCKANHTNYHFPTDKRPKKIYLPKIDHFHTIKQNVKQNVNMHSSEMNLLPEKPVHKESVVAKALVLLQTLPPQKKEIDTAHLNSTIESLENEVSLLKDKLRKLQKHSLKLESDLKKYNSVPHQSTVVECMNQIRKIKLSCMSSDSSAAVVIAKAIFQDDCLKGLLRNEVINLSRKFISSNIYSPQNILKLMDLNGGALNYHSIELLRSIESNGKAYHKCLLPSSSSLKRAAKKLEKAADLVVPFTIYNHGEGEGFIFNFRKLFIFICDSFKLSQVTTYRPIDFSATIDGSQLSKNKSHVLAGMKLNDIASRDPVSGAPCFINVPPNQHEDLEKLMEENLMEYKSVQSRNYCFPFQCQLTKETKKSYDAFESFFKFATEIGESGEIFGKKGSHAVNINNIADLSAHWKGLKRGSGKKNNVGRPCISCPLMGKDFNNANKKNCTRWCSMRPSNWRCYHKEIATENVVKEMESKLLLLFQEISRDVTEIEGQSKIQNENEYALGRETNRNSIHFQPTNQDQINEFSILLREELILRNLNPSGSIETRRERLKDALEKEYLISELKGDIDHCRPQESALYAIMCAIPCILHAENRMGLKFIWLILNEGVANARKLRIDFCQNINSEVQRVDKFIELFERCVNTDVLGTCDFPSQWKCPRDKDGTILDITMDNGRVRKIMKRIDRLIDFCMRSCDVERNIKWKRCMANYNNSMKILCQHTDYTVDDLIEYQTNVDDFFQVYSELVGLEGITNYIHIISSGHMVDYMQRWKCLYRFSNQGWEAYNSLFKSVYFRRTSRGGRMGGGDHTVKTILTPIARWCQRRVMWICGRGDEVFDVDFEEESFVGRDKENNSDTYDSENSEQEMDEEFIYDI